MKRPWFAVYMMLSSHFNKERLFGNIKCDLLRFRIQLKYLKVLDSDESSESQQWEEVGEDSSESKYWWRRRWRLGLASEWWGRDVEEVCCKEWQKSAEIYSTKNRFCLARRRQARKWMDQSNDVSIVSGSDEQWPRKAQRMGQDWGNCLFLKKETLNITFSLLLLFCSAACSDCIWWLIFSQTIISALIVMFVQSGLKKKDNDNNLIYL